MGVEDFFDDIDYDKIIKKDSEFMEVYEAFGYGQFKPQKTLIFFNKKLLETEEDLARNPDSEYLQQRKIEIEDYLAKIHKILGTENEKVKPDTFYDSIPKKIQLQIDYLFSVHPKFKQYFSAFKENDYIDISADFIQWKKGKVALTKFIKLFAGEEKKYHWSLYEKLFDRNDLRSAEGSYPDATCIEYDKMVKKIEGESK
jgi:hypothetical protein